MKVKSGKMILLSKSCFSEKNRRPKSLWEQGAVCNASLSTKSEKYAITQEARFCVSKATISENVKAGEAGGETERQREE